MGAAQQEDNGRMHESAGRCTGLMAQCVPQGGVEPSLAADDLGPPLRILGRTSCPSPLETGPCRWRFPQEAGFGVHAISRWCAVETGSGPSGPRWQQAKMGRLRCLVDTKNNNWKRSIIRTPAIRAPRAERPGNPAPESAKPSSQPSRRVMRCSC